MSAFWDIEPRGLIEIYQYVRGGSFIAPMEAVCTSETSVYFRETTRR